MLQLQFFRSILLINNAVAATVAFCTTAWWRREVFFSLASFLLASWIMNAMVLLYTAWRLRVTNKGYDYFRVPVQNDNFEVPYTEPSSRPHMGWKASVLIKVADIVLIIPLLTLMILGFCTTLRSGPVVACIGAIVAVIVHGFCFIVSFDFKRLRQYRVKLVIVRHNEQVMITERFPQPKEQRTSQVPSMQQPSPESISPRPYRGSPSTKPSKTSNSPLEGGPIKLIEASEGDALMADHD